MIVQNNINTLTKLYEELLNIERNNTCNNIIDIAVTTLRQMRQTPHTEIDDFFFNAKNLFKNI